MDVYYQIWQESNNELECFWQLVPHKITNSLNRSIIRVIATLKVIQVTSTSLDNIFSSKIWDPQIFCGPFCCKSHKWPVGCHLRIEVIQKCRNANVDLKWEIPSELEAKDNCKNAEKLKI